VYGREDALSDLGLNERGILEIVLTGEVTDITIDRLHAEIMKIIKEKNAKAVLSDVSGLKRYNDPFAAAYFRVRSIPQEIGK
jgi:hypothetical protein